MGFLDSQLTELAERIMERLDLEAVTKDVLSKLIITDLDLYFVGYQMPDCEGYTFVGMAYNEQAAEIIWLENSKLYPCDIFRLDMDKVVTLISESDIAEKIR